jgi:hypothetical protein
MKTSSPTFSLFFGKTVKDEYGYTVGKIILIKDEGSSKYVLIESGNGDIVSYPLVWLKPEGGEFILLSSLKFKAKELIENIPLLWRKNQILEEISEEKSLPTEELGDIERNFKEELNRLKSEAQIVLKDVDAQMKKCNLQIKELTSASVYLKIELGISSVDRASLLEAENVVQKGIERIELRRKDLEDLQRRLNNVMLGEVLEDSESSDLSGAASSKRKDTGLVVRIEDISDFQA